MMWTKAELERELTWEEFEKDYLEDFKTWVSKRPRRLKYWLASVEDWAVGRH